MLEELNAELLEKEANAEGRPARRVRVDDDLAVFGSFASSLVVIELEIVG